VRDVLDDEARDRLVQNVVGHVSKGVKEPVLSRVFEYWRNIDADLGKRSRKAFKATSTATTHKHNTPKRPKRQDRPRFSTNKTIRSPCRRYGYHRPPIVLPSSGYDHRGRASTPIDVEQTAPNDFRSWIEALPPPSNVDNPTDKSPPRRLKDAHRRVHDADHQQTRL
jgi:Catalase-related immune-responsive